MRRRVTRCLIRDRAVRQLLNFGPKKRFFLSAQKSFKKTRGSWVFCEGWGALNTELFCCPKYKARSRALTRLTSWFTLYMYDDTNFPITMCLHFIKYFIDTIVTVKNDLGSQDNHDKPGTMNFMVI